MKKSDFSPRLADKLIAQLKRRNVPVAKAVAEGQSF
jgi:hypothetical protein